MYKSIISFFVLLFMMLVFSGQETPAQNLEMVKLIDIGQEVTKKENWKHLQVFTSDKKKIGNYLSLDLCKLLMDNIKDLNKVSFNNLVIMLESNNGRVMFTTGYDYKSYNNKSVPNLIIKPTNRAPFIPKTLKDTDVEGEVNLSSLENDLFAKTFLHLRTKDKNINSLKNLIQENTVIFPDDLSADRWFSGLKSIKIYRYLIDIKEKD